MSDEPIPAATLILVRDAAEGAELLLVERAEGMAFAAGAMVFPGGRIDQADRDLAERFGIEAGVVAAVRETIEETAVPAGLVQAPTAAEALKLQQALIADQDFGELLAEGRLSIDAEALVPFARWVPKFHAVRRFDTLFYVTRCPDGEWAPNAIPGECAGAFWVRAGDVVEAEKRGEARLIFPTRRTLERLALFRSFDEIRADALAHPIEAITPWIEEEGGEKFITIPGHLGFPVTQERLDGLWRG
jgi:8-oxo-dGTP pyrophosphatase MutT (NUDIX family)